MIVRGECLKRYVSLCLHAEKVHVVAYLSVVIS